MADLNDALERLISDPAFRQALGDDPEKALEGYALSEEDLKMLSAQLSDDPGVRGGLEQRTSKSALAGLFGGGGSGESDLEFLGRHTEHGDGTAPLEEQIGFAYKNISFDDGESLTSSPQDSGAPGGDMPIESMSLNFEKLGEEDGEFLAASGSDPVAYDDSHEVEMDVHVGRSEPEPPSDFTAGGDTDEGSSGVDGTGKTDSGKYVVSSVHHGAGSGSDGGESLGSTPESAPGGENSSNWIRVRGDWGEPDEPSVQDMSFTKISDKSSVNTGPGEETEENIGLSSPHISKAAFDSGGVPGPEPDQAVAASDADDDSSGEIKNEKWLRDRYLADGDTDQPIIAGTVYNPSGAQAGSSAPADLSDGGVHELPGALIFEAPAEPIVIAEPLPPPAPTGAGLRSEGELVQGDDAAPGDLGPTGRGAEEGIEGTDVSTGYTSEPGDIGDDLPDDPPED